MRYGIQRGSLDGVYCVRLLLSLPPWCFHMLLAVLHSDSASSSSPTCPPRCFHRAKVLAYHSSWSRFIEWYKPGWSG